MNWFDITASSDTPVAHFVTEKVRHIYDPVNIIKDVPSSSCARAGMLSEKSGTITDSRIKEFNSMVEHGIFALVDEGEATNHYIYGLRFCDEIKYERN